MTLKQAEQPANKSEGAAEKREISCSWERLDKGLRDPLESLPGNAQPRHLIYTHEQMGQWGLGSQSFPLEVVRIVPGGWIHSHSLISKHQCSAHTGNRLTGKTQIPQKLKLKDYITKHPLHQLRADQSLTKLSEQFKISTSGFNKALRAV